MQNVLDAAKGPARNRPSSLESEGSVGDELSAEDIRGKKKKELEDKFNIAVNAGDLEKVKSLLLQGITLKDYKEPHGCTPLHIASYDGHLDLVQFFLGIREPEIGKPDINARDPAGWTGLKRGGGGVVFSLENLQNYSLALGYESRTFGYL